MRPYSHLCQRGFTEPPLYDMTEFMLGKESAVEILILVQ